jgi:hypothetical protein
MSLKMQKILKFQTFSALRLAALIIALPALISCGGGGSAACQAGVGVLLGTNCSPQTNTSPVANAGFTQNVITGSIVNLDGSGSTDAEKDTLTYKWELIGKPASSTATLLGATTAKPSFTADKAGTYTLSLVVNDAKVNSALVTLNVFAGSASTNTAPVANAGITQNVLIGAKVYLDGTGSTDAENDPIIFKWTMAARPSGSLAALNSTSTPSPNFTADEAGTYLVTLTVNDGRSDSGSVTVIIIASTGNIAPIANAGLPQNLVLGTLGTKVTLDGTGSSDPNNDFITYKWTMTSKPTNGAVNSTATLTDSTTSKPYFTADLAGTYVVALVVNDGKLDSPVSTNVITVAAANSKPVANAGANQSVNLGADVILDGTASSDANFDTLSYEWILVAKPSGSSATLSSSSSPKPSFNADKEGTYLVSLVVSDGKLSSTMVTTTVTATLANAAPVANAGPYQNVVLGKFVTLDATGSTDANKDTLSYTWLMVSRPTLSSAVLSSTTDAKPTFTADRIGTYVFSLMASDGKLTSPLAVTAVTAEVANSVPVANAGPTQSLYLSLLNTSLPVTLNGTGSTDANGDTLTYNWTLTTQPAGSSAVLSSTTAAKPTFSASVAGIYVATLVVNDGKVDSAISTVAVQVY